MSAPLVSASPSSLDVGYLFLVNSNFLLSMVVQQLVALLVFLQKVSTRPFTPPSYTCAVSTGFFMTSRKPKWLLGLKQFGSGKIPTYIISKVGENESYIKYTHTCSHPSVPMSQSLEH